ncbi:TVP38/TMEM64 family protein [Candidatus Magnetaquicoccus inordinatus]|uniref:TVP38/TMEM64 family protein n=1 Tax=Candidatus Magnetaquicoccus inordinatus TaxID=2496818 RepID=UPI00102C1EAC|nr:TVP38/TMEM64 family protein [Candidatus Magnetaquicoccus inordinatus]
MKISWQGMVVLLLLLALGGLLQHLLTLENLKELYQKLQAFYQLYPIGTALLFFLSYMSMTALSLPGLTLLMLAGGALFGLALGTLLVSFASSIGCAMAFLLSRHLLRDWVQARWGKELHPIQEGFARDGAVYLLSLRLLPIIPSFLVNLLMGLTPIPLRTFYLVSQIGMLAATMLYVQAGSRLSQLHHPADILSLELFLLLLLLAMLPVLANTLLKRYKSIYSIMI